jgi:hypothetical protein
MGFTPSPPPPPGNTGSSGSSSSGGGSPASGSAISASAQQTHARQVADSFAAFTALIGFYIGGVGLKEGGNIHNLIKNASNGLWSTDRFIAALAKTKEFHKAFPGIMNKNGTLRMNPSQYIADRATITTAANAAGVNLSGKQLDQMMVNRVDPSIAQQRFQVEASYTKNAGTFDAFNAELKAAGHKPMNKAAVTKFIMGQGSPAFYNLYQDWQTRVSAQAAGFQIATPEKNHKGKIIGWKTTANDLELSRKQEIAIAGSAGGPSGTAPDLTKAAQMFRDVLPEARMAAMDISKNDIIQYLYGGPQQATIQAKIDQFGKNLQAESNDTGVSVAPTNFGQRGLASKNRAQTGY